MTVSSYFLEYEATVLGIVNCCTLRVRITGYPYLDPANNPGPIDRKIHLAGISKPKRNSAAAAECEAHLTHALLGSRVHILATFGREHDARWLPVVLHLPNGTDENRQLLLSGLAAFAEQRPYELDWWMACDYQLAEKTAKEQHLGIWAASP